MHGDNSKAVYIERTKSGKGPFIPNENDFRKNFVYIIFIREFALVRCEWTLKINPKSIIRKNTDIVRNPFDHRDVIVLELFNSHTGNLVCFECLRFRLRLSVNSRMAITIRPFTLKNRNIFYFEMSSQIAIQLFSIKKDAKISKQPNGHSAVHTQTETEKETGTDGYRVHVTSIYYCRLSYLSRC